jgi:hypothetical protein
MGGNAPAGNFAATSYTVGMNAIDLECPQCGAKPGERCRTYTGKWQPVAHAKRKRAAFEADMRRQATREEDTEAVPTPTKES